MLKDHYSRSERHELMALAPLVHEAELRQLLGQLDAQFARWRTGELSSSDLNDAIHQYHHHDARWLWSVYQGLKRDSVVARGLALELIREAQLSPGLLAKLSPMVITNKALFAERPGDDTSDGDERAVR